MTQLPDAELIRQVRSGAVGAYEALYRRHVEAARTRARYFAQCADDADDFVAGAFAAILRALQSGRGPQYSFRRYLLTSVRNEAYQDARRRRREVLHPDTVEVSDRLGIELEFSACAADEARSARAVLAAFWQLPDRWQAVLRLADLQDKPNREIAPLVGLTNANSVTQLRCRARRGLRAAYFQTLTATRDQGLPA